MSAHRFVAMLATVFALLLCITQASNLRNSIHQNQEVPSGSSSSESVAQDSTPAVPSDAQSTTSESKDSSIVETQSSLVEDASADGVKAWAQCGGLYYLGETRCQPHTFCKKLSDFISVCFPESRPTEKVIRLEL
ncbi:hypothetical protein PHYSODRAFT_355996 [Phytophthora sojae]|uniref:CBM1 domain-containing protein n=1 Tax=Phytophthora sojae (strain P6497) TaxID=1094619 RepID=G5A974_PHYSP|nr:hypothetical protein PHYSODRAFT_355996 [Phytophthora sojae]EGZ08450.1 hypothetical protein PHYSODRAFT_355996 [Phytophthora sojae]|eukprot:XP_009536622.1 hypothetical protein PHYSODRAFT_355996 [Phytophthora sojae]